MNKDKPTIVTIDDDKITLNYIYELFKRRYIVYPFPSAKPALKFLQTRGADLILLDNNMPEMTGFEALIELRGKKETENIPVIFLTGSDDLETESKAFENGAVDFLRKPIQPDIAIKRVELHIKLNQYQNYLERIAEENMGEVEKKNIELKQKNEQLSDMMFTLSRHEKTVIEILAKASDLRDSTTGEHVRRTTEYTRILLDELRKLREDMPEDYVISDTDYDNIISAAKLHDIGKISIPDRILLKESRLTDAEFEVIKSHPVQGAKMITDAEENYNQDNLFKEIINVVLYHHEKWNGGGYPKGLSGKDIPFSARIVAIADVFDALTSIRPYKPAFPLEKAFEILYEESGNHFDPELIKIVKNTELRFAEFSQLKF